MLKVTVADSTKKILFHPKEYQLYGAFPLAELPLAELEAPAVMGIMTVSSTAAARYVIHFFVLFITPLPFLSARIHMGFSVFILADCFSLYKSSERFVCR